MLFFSILFYLKSFSITFLIDKFFFITLLMLFWVFLNIFSFSQHELTHTFFRCINNSPLNMNKPSIATLSYLFINRSFKQISSFRILSFRVFLLIHVLFGENFILNSIIYGCNKLNPIVQKLN